MLWEGRGVSAGKDEPGKVVWTPVTFAPCLWQLIMHILGACTLLGTGGTQ